MGSARVTRVKDLEILKETALKGGRFQKQLLLRNSVQRVDVIVRTGSVPVSNEATEF